MQNAAVPLKQLAGLLQEAFHEPRVPVCPDWADM